MSFDSQKPIGNKFGPEQAENASITAIDKALQDPDYSRTQFYLYEGRIRGSYSPSNAEGLQAALSELWWIRVMNNPQVQTKLQGLLKADYVSLKENQSLAAIRALGRQFYKAADGREALGPSPNAPQMKVAALKEADVTGDAQGALGNTIKAETIGGQPGYGSLQWGVTPERTAEFLGLDESKKIVVAGVGPGDFARYSLPPESNIYGIDYSTGMVARARERGIRATQGNVSDRSTWEKMREEFGQPDAVVADYFLDVAERPVDAIRNMAESLPTGGRLMVTILIPINQTGFDSKLFTGSPEKALKLEVTQDIGNTKNPWKDVLKLKGICEQLSLQLKSFSVTSYVQYDSGRQDKALPGEIRPSGILVFEKI